MVARRILVAVLVLLPFGMLARAALENPEPAGKRPLYKSPLGLAVDPSGQRALVALHGADALAIVDLKHNEVLCEIPVGQSPYDVAYHKGMAYVTCEGDDTLVVVDVAGREVKRVFKVGQAPRGVSVDPASGHVSVVCHDDNMLWTLTSAKGTFTKTPIPPQPDGNFARARNVELVLGARAGQAAYRPVSRPFGLFTEGASVFAPRSAPPKPGPAKAKKSSAKGLASTLLAPGVVAPQRTAFNPVFDFDYARTGMDLVAHTRARWFTPTVQAPEGRVFTNALSFFVNSQTPAGIVLLDEPRKGYPDPTDIVVQLPRQWIGKKALALGTTGKADAHPLKGARVFISSGGADTVVVLDLHKAAKDIETHPPQPFGTFGWGSGGIGGISGAGGIGGFTGTGGVGGIGGIGGGPPAHPFPPGGLPGNGGFPGNNFGGINGLNGGFNIGALGWNGGFQLGGFGGIREDLTASKSYTIARLPTQSNPRRMTLTPDGKTLIVSNHLSDSLTLIDANKLVVLRHIDLGGPAPDAARKGEILFHSAKATFQQQFSCASCHPGGGSDGLAWNTSKDGKGEHLNTRSLLGVGDTAPFGWRGESKTLPDRIKNTMREVHKHKISDADALDIAAFLETLDPPRPLRQREDDKLAAERGKALFFGKGGCKRCHRGDAYTSDSPRAVIADNRGEFTPFDVPSLRGVGRTAPYLHDGRAATLADIFLNHNPQQRHGNAHRLTPAELNDVIAFLKSL